MQFHSKFLAFYEVVLLGFKRQNGLNDISKHENTRLPMPISLLDGAEQVYFQKTYIESFSNFLTTSSSPQRLCLHQQLQIIPHIFQQVHHQTTLPLFNPETVHFSLKYLKRTSTLLSK